MKKFTFFLILNLFFYFSFAQIVDIPDANFKNALLNMSVANLQQGYSYGQNYSVDSVVDLNGDGEIQVSEAESVYGLSLNYVWNINSLNGIEYFTNLEYLNFRNNDVTSVDLSNNVGLKYLSCDSNNLSTINVSNNLSLERLDISGNSISSVDVSMLVNLKDFDCQSNLLTNLTLDSNTNLEIVNCRNNFLTTLNTSNNPSMISLYCSNNQLTSLDLSMNSNLFSLNCNENLITNLDLSNNQVLNTLSCGENQLIDLNVSNCNDLEYLYTAVNQLQELDLSNNINLEYLAIIYNDINTLDLSSLENLETLYVKDNQLVSIDISNNPNIEAFLFNNNPLQTMNIKNGATMSNYFNINTIPTLEHICVDQEELDQLQALVSNSNVSINTYCSFNPGGEYFTIQGENRVDTNTNGCDTGDNFYPNVKLDITDGTNSGTYFADSSGNYSVPVSEGTHTITPVIEDTDYFIVSPNSATVTFPDDGSPFTQDFCFTPNGVHNDVEVFIVPTSVAIPGFDSHYNIIYRNKGNTTLSGTINLDFEDDYMDFLSANPSEDIANIGNLQWFYAGLQPFETRVIEVSFNLNTPTDSSFPLNDGDILDFDINITPYLNDETQADNSFGLKQIVVNSFDPNDITCLEGTAILPEHVGEYVHYMIRFENLGTANATNIVVKDVIDETKFDVSSLFPLHASHNFTTRIREGNIVEFIFENIQLPFDDASNDGYMVFKIKTLDTLQLGDTFENEAEIYFDFNFPVITNNYTTEVAEANLGIDDYDAESVRLFPNPARDKIYIKSISNLNSVKIFDVNGRLIINQILEGFILEINIGIDGLTSGIYFLEAVSNTRKSVQKFVKQ